VAAKQLHQSQRKESAMTANYVVVVFTDGEVVKGIITGTYNDNDGGIYLHADGADVPAARDFAEMKSMTVIG
jgi:hypothetical protein